MKKNNFEFSGILLVDKPSGFTSHDVVNFIRKKFSIKKAGHAGSLDPAATGLMIILIGYATKLSAKLTDMDKTYDGKMMLGTETDSQDMDGKVIAQKDYSCISDEDIKKVFAKFQGEIEQVPPMFSAVKKGGKKLYELARKGIEIEREAKKVIIHKLEIKKIEKPFIDFSVKCSKGTYVRTLCSDIGKELGCGATLHSLRRTESGIFKLSDAFPIEEIEKWTQDKLLANIIDLFNLNLNKNNLEHEK